MNQINTDALIKDAITYVKSLNTQGYEYLFSKSCTDTTLYASVYACMIRGWNDSFDDIDKRDWSEYFNSFQDTNGFYIDTNSLNENYYSRDGWGARHLIPHMIIALNRLDAKPKYEFSFVDKLKTPDAMISFLKKLDYQNIWASSNVIMNYGVTMQYARDYMGAPYQDSLNVMEEWLVQQIRTDCAMWQERPIENANILYETIRGAYHIYPILLYDNIDIPYFEKAIPYLLRAQNKQGGFDMKANSSACDDIDAIDPLVRSAVLNGMQNRLRVKIAIKKAKKNVMRNRNEDGGFVFSRDASFVYGGAEQLSSRKNESNLFGTWFRLLSLLIIDNFYGVDSNKLMWFPGYELRIGNM